MFITVEAEDLCFVCGLQTSTVDVCYEAPLHPECEYVVDLYLSYCWENDSHR